MPPYRRYRYKPRRTRRRTYRRRNRNVTARSRFLRKPQYKPMITQRWCNFAEIFDLGATSGLNIIAGATSGTSSFLVQDYLIINTAPTANTYLAFTYAAQFRHIVNVVEFSGLFDRYKINGVSFKIIPIVNTYLAAPGVATNTGTTIDRTNSSVCMPLVHWVIDYEDVVVPLASQAGIDRLRQYNNYKVVRFDGSNKIAKRFWKPKILVGAQADDNAANITSFTRKAPWINTAQTNVDHMGLKGIIEILNPTTSAAYVNLKVEVKFYFSVNNQQ